MSKYESKMAFYPVHYRSGVALARASLFKFAALLAGVILLASGLLIYIAHNLDRNEEAESAFYTRKAVQSLEKSSGLMVKDYAFWGEAYKHLHAEVDTDWAFVRQNIGSTLYERFGFEGVFVVDASNRTAYSVIYGSLQNVDLAQWLAQPIDTILDRARAGAANETPLAIIVNVHGVPAVVAAAAITPGSDPTVALDEGPASVLIFVELLDSARLDAIGKDYGVQGLHISTSAETHDAALYPLGKTVLQVHCAGNRPSLASS